MKEQGKAGLPGPGHPGHFRSRAAPLRVRAALGIVATVVAVGLTSAPAPGTVPEDGGRPERTCRPPEGLRLDRELADEVRTLLEDADPNRRERAAWRIGLLAPEAPSPRAGRPAEASGSEPAAPEGDVRAQPKSHGHALVAALYDPARRVRMAAVCSLGRVGGQAALEHLARRARDRDPEMAAAVAWARERILARDPPGRP